MSKYNAYKVIKAVSYNSDHDFDDMMSEVGVVCIEGSGRAGQQTLCGFVDTKLRFEETTDRLNCPVCIEIYKGVKAMTGKVLPNKNGNAQ